MDEIQLRASLHKSNLNGMNPRQLLKNRDEICLNRIDLQRIKITSFHVCTVVRELKGGRSQGKDIYRQRFVKPKCGTCRRQRPAKRSDGVRSVL